MDPVTQAKTLLQQRIEEIDKERKPIERALQELEARRSSGRPPARRRQSTSTRTAVRGGDRAKQALRIITANPGIKIPDLARKMKLNNNNYLYRIIPGLPVEKGEDGGLSVKPDPS